MHLLQHACKGKGEIQAHYQTANQSIGDQVSR